jgi:hypothetical protein
LEEGNFEPVKECGCGEGIDSLITFPEENLQGIH